MPSIQSLGVVGGIAQEVLNLVINGMPSILRKIWMVPRDTSVLNLVINGMPSILAVLVGTAGYMAYSFKPCYKWNAFNTR